MSQAPEVAATGFPWYEEASFAEVRRMMADGHKLHRTYAEWFAAATLGEKHMTSRGERVIRAPIVPEAFRAWCAERGLPMNAAARGQYAAAFARDVILKERRGRKD